MNLGLFSSGLGPMFPACSYCAQSSGSSGGYYLATLVMLVVPLVLIAGLTVWMLRASRGAEAVRFAEEVQ